MQNKLEQIKETLENPLKVISILHEADVRYYYKHYKNVDSCAKYLRVIVKYLNGKGFVITAYFVESIK